MISDLTQALREEELQAWQRLVRVLGHELNNSLAPIKSIAGSLGVSWRRDPLPDDWRDDMRRGLTVITSRSETLSRFMAPMRGWPSCRGRNCNRWTWPVRGRARRASRRACRGIVARPGHDVQGDPDQLEQVLINLLRNAVDASLTTSGGVAVGWRRDGSMLEIRIQDDGPGLSNTANLFVPFFTTKPGDPGSGWC